MKAIASVIVWLLALLSWPTSILGAVQTIHIPINVDYSFIRANLIRQAYTEPGEKAIPLNLNDGCTKMELWNPEVGPEKSLLKLGSLIKLQAGLPIGRTCVPVAQWEGQINVLQQLIFDQATSRLGLQPVGFQALGPDKKQTSIDKTLVDLIQSYLNPYLSKVTFDFGGAVKGLQTVLPLFASDRDKDRFVSWLNTLRLGGVQLQQDAINLDVLMDVDAAATSKEGAQAPISETEAIGVTKAWENGDAFMEYQIQSLVGHPVAEDERSTVLETLLDKRYEFVQASEEGALSHNLVLQQFAGGWQSLGPIIRKYLSGKLASSPTNYLSYFGTSDALTTLSKAELGFTPQISRNGLLQLAKLLSGTHAEPALNYSPAVNNDLLQFFGLGQDLSDSGPIFNGFEIDLPEGARLEPSPKSFLTSLSQPSPAFADEPAAEYLEQVRPWIMPKEEAGPYLDRVKAALKKASEDVSARGKLDPKDQAFFRRLVFSTAWQESCWRQFLRKGGKVSPIVSYNQSSVGLMQINVRVWRGIYRPESLLWNTPYNIQAGCEILDLYLRRYALKRAASRNLDNDTLARIVYAMYNGGPGQLQKFLIRRKNNAFFKVDKLFWEKYTWVKAGQFDKLSVCLGPFSWPGSSLP